MRGHLKSEIDLHIIKEVKKLRIENKISQAILATKLDVSDAFIGQIENPKHTSKYSMVHLNKLAKIFNCSPRYFLPEKPL
jgi:transcriptional regulator with XRE-family HTH domain